MKFSKLEHVLFDEFPTDEVNNQFGARERMLYLEENHIFISFLQFIQHF